MLCPSFSLVPELKKMFAFHVAICKTDLFPIWLFSHWGAEDAAWITQLWFWTPLEKCCRAHVQGEKTADSQSREGTRRGTKLGNALKIHSTISPGLLVSSKLTGSFQLCFWTRLLLFLTGQQTIGSLYTCPLHGWGGKSAFLNKG